MFSRTNRSLVKKRPFLTFAVALLGFSLVNILPFTATSGTTQASSVVTPTPFEMAFQGTNTPPTFTPGPPLTVRQGERKAVIIGSVNDAEQQPQALGVTVVRLLSGPPGGQNASLIGNPTPNADKTVSATLEATCSTTVGTYVYEVTVTDGLLTNTTQTSITINVTPSFTVSIQPGSKINIRGTVRVGFNVIDSVTAPIPGITNIDPCSNLAFRFERDDSKYTKRLSDTNDAAYFTVDRVPNGYAVRFSPFIPDRITNAPTAGDCLPNLVRTRLIVLGPNGQPVSGVNEIPITVRVETDLRLFPNAFWVTDGRLIRIIYQVWDSDLNTANYDLCYRFFDFTGNQIGHQITAETQRLRSEINRSVAERRLVKGQSFLVIQTFDSTAFSANTQNIEITLSDGQGNPRIVAPRQSARTVVNGTEIDWMNVKEGDGTIVLPPAQLTLQESEGVTK
ncbi:MAG: hypothetical protein HY774_08940 [Acidobacteria bacterium]|nr:hypothetical protein [Acidobacteriota bacterium]